MQDLKSTFIGVLNSHGEPTWDNEIRPSGEWVCGCGHILPDVTPETPLTWTWPEHVAKALEYVTPCNCILEHVGGWGGHTRGDHEDERCKAQYTMSGPPCGGCINCVQAQAYYYESERAKRD